MAEITIIPAKSHADEIVRTAAYARVSSDSEDQLNSFAAQIRYYTELLQNSTNTVFVDMYADQGITGTSAAKRTEFQRLMSDCRKGKIDRILTKSISRFARNTKDSLEAVRERKPLELCRRYTASSPKRNPCRSRETAVWECRKEWRTALTEPLLPRSDMIMLMEDCR